MFDGANKRLNSEHFLDTVVNFYGQNKNREREKKKEKKREKNNHHIETAYLECIVCTAYISPAKCIKQFVPITEYIFRL